MSILRRGIIMPNSGAGKDSADGISVKCPKCQAVIMVTGMRGEAPVRCSKCNYPMILRSDLSLLIAACQNVKTAAQANSAVSILRRLSEFMPEAGAALGLLPSQVEIALPLSEKERWNTLVNAYCAGNERAREGLQVMIKSSPELYGQRTCKNCGAPKYYERHVTGRTVCAYCQNAD